jgi:hypothetical protein
MSMKNWNTVENWVIENSLIYGIADICICPIYSLALYGRGLG